MSRIASQPGTRRVAIAKPKNDIYVALLAIALGALLLAILLLALEMNRYSWSVQADAGSLRLALQAVVPGGASPLADIEASPILPA